MFKQNPEEGSDEKTMRLGTSRVDEAFDDDTDMLRNDFSDVMTDNETERLRQMRNMRCPDGTKGTCVGFVSLPAKLLKSQEKELGDETD